MVDTNHHVAKMGHGAERNDDERHALLLVKLEGGLFQLDGDCVGDGTVGSFERGREVRREGERKGEHGAALERNTRTSCEKTEENGFTFDDES